MAIEDGRTPAWGDPAPTYADHDGSGGATTGESVDLTAGAAHQGPGDQNSGDGSPRIGSPRDQNPGDQDPGDQNPGDQNPRDQDPGTVAQGWATVAPVMVSENGSGTATGRRPSEPGWPPGPAHAAVKRRREHRVLRGIRSGVALTVIALALGVAAAAALGLIVWLIATAIHHAAAN